MSSPFKLTRKEIEAIKKLEMRIKDSLLLSQKEDPTLFYRFLKARDFDVDKAETMLRKNIAWRKAFQMDTLLDTFKPKEVFLKHTGSCRICLDKEGNIVRYAPTGKCDPRDLVNSMKMNDYMKHVIWAKESDTQLLEREIAKSGRKAYQGIQIYDLNGLTFASAASRTGADILIRVIHLMQDNYPECMKYAFVIQSGWKEALLEVIDANVLPAFLGGTRTDPDGDPSCKTFVMQGGRIPPEYILPEEDRCFKNMNKVKRAVVSPGLYHRVLVDVETSGSVIQWEFETKSKDIGFGLFFQMTNGELEEVLPIQRISTYDGIEIGSFKCGSIGTYVITFDNSHSWWKSKEILYCIAVD